MLIRLGLIVILFFQLACGTDGSVEESASLHVLYEDSVCVSDNLNLRSEPNTEAFIVGKLKPGLDLEVLSFSEDNLWAKVQITFEGARITGWVAKRYLCQTTENDTIGGVQSYTAKATAYYPDPSPLEGGFLDERGAKLRTLQAYLRGEVEYVSVAMDLKLRRKGVPYGTIVRIPELEEHYGRSIEFRVVDNGGAFVDKGFSRIDICVENRRESLRSPVNGQVTLIFAGI
ncbi:MAG: SH3 domain-containing protein [Pseudobacteriovorax sp.]|nr:SH3 domain-containing protein [Pseudobacteriovorax sp.]